MYISKIRVCNYKSFEDSEWLEFDSGINIIIGQNNSGKTALLEALSLDFFNAPHRSLKTVAEVNSQISTESYVEVILVFEKEEIRKFIKQMESRGEEVGIFPSAVESNLEFQSAVEEFNQWFNSSSPGNFSFRRNHKENSLILTEQLNIEFNFGLYPPDKRLRMFVIKQNTHNSSFHFLYNRLESQTNDFLHFKLLKMFLTKIYRFDGGRISIGECGSGCREELEPDASNLPEVLHCLQSNQSRFKKFNKYVSDVLPNINTISIKLTINNTLKVMVWEIDHEQYDDREDLAIPLSACGAGVAQILAILYVVFNVQEPRTILIDEPGLYLHPGSLKKLIEILKEFRQHQYFIATHSPQVIAVTKSSHPNITQIYKEENQSKASAVDANSKEQLGLILSEVGVRLSDIFGADNILWVEGITEEQCFPLILEKLVDQSLWRGTQIIRVKNTGDFVQKKKQLASNIFHIYDNLSLAKTLLPPAVKFIFDKESLSQSEMEDIKRGRTDKVVFLERRMYENYLLHPEAIAYVLNEEKKRSLTKEEIEEKERLLTKEEIEAWLEENQNNQKYFPKSQEKPQADWRFDIHATSLIDDLFKKFAGAEVTFTKPTHPTLITKWILENDPNYFQEIADFLKSLFKE